MQFRFDAIRLSKGPIGRTTNNQKFPANNMTCRIIIENSEIKIMQGTKKRTQTHLKSSFSISIHHLTMRGIKTKPYSASFQKINR